MKLNKNSKDRLLVGGIALIQFLLHLFTNGAYGVFRDEFYYLECAKHLAWGYVDHPPLSIFLLAVWRILFGDSVIAIRILPALSGSLLIVLTAMIAKAFGGKRFAQTVAALGVALAPGFLGMTSFYSMNAYDLLFWTAGILLVIHILKSGNSRLWLLFGVLMGLGLQNKISVLFFGFALVVALLLTPERKVFFNAYFWLGGGIALLFFLPHILWQIAHDWPTLEFMANAKQYKIADMTPLQFFLESVLEIGPANMILWLTGLLFLIFSRPKEQRRLWGLFYITVLILLLLQKGKPYYLSPAYPVLFAAGALALEQWTDKRRWIRTLLVANTIFGGAVSMPMAVPLLQVDQFIAYEHMLGFSSKNAENSELGALPQHFADRFGWQEMTQAFAGVFASLPADQQNDCIILTSNYGEAGAINYYSKDYRVPPAKSQHNNFYLWGPGPVTDKTTYLIIGQNKTDLENTFDSVLEGAIISNKYSMPYENNLTITICRGLKRPMRQAWKDGKNFI